MFHCLLSSNADKLPSYRGDIKETSPPNQNVRFPTCPSLSALRSERLWLMMGALVGHGLRMTLAHPLPCPSKEQCEFRVLHFAIV